MLKKLLKKSVKLNSLVCLIVCFTLMSNNVFAGSDLDRALSSGVESVNRHKKIGEDLAIALSPEIEPVIVNNKYNNFTSKTSLEYDLVFLSQLSDEELLPLVKLMKDRVSNQLSEAAIAYPQLHLSEIINELEKYAGNTFMNIWRGKGVPYRELLEDVCKKLDIEIEDNMSVDRMGAALIQHTFATALDNMTAEQKTEFFANLEEIMGRESYEELLKEAGDKHGLQALSGDVVAMLLLKSGSFGLPKTSAVIAFGFFNAVGLSASSIMEVGGVLTPIIGVLFSPVVLTIFGVLGAIDVASPATRVTVPAALYIESMRIVKGKNAYANSISY